MAKKKINKTTGDKQAIPNNVAFAGNSRGFVELKVSEVYTNQKIDNVEFEDKLLQDTYNEYLKTRENLINCEVNAIVNNNHFQ